MRQNMKKGMLLTLSGVMLASVVAVTPMMDGNRTNIGEEIGAQQSQSVNNVAMNTIHDTALRTLASESGTALLTVPAGTQVTATSKVGEWYKVSLQGKTGYVASSSLEGAVSASAVSSKLKFSDVRLFPDEISYLTGLGIINGHSDGTFKPKDSLKRVHAVQMILREMGEDGKSAPNPGFADMKPGDYGYSEVAKAVQLGFINGSVDKKGKKTFNPNKTLTRGEMAKILTEAYKLQKDKGMTFSDVSSKHWTKPYVSRLATAGITNGHSDGTFKPNDSIERQHFAAFMARLLNPKFIPGAAHASNEPVKKPIQSNLMSLGNAQDHISQIMTAYESNAYELLSPTGVRQSVLVGFESTTTGKAHLAVNIIDYISVVEVQPEDFGQESYDVAKAFEVKMNKAMKVYAETQFGIGTAESKKLVSETQSLALKGNRGDVKKLTLQGKAVTLKYDGTWLAVSYQ